MILSGSPFPESATRGMKPGSRYLIYRSFSSENFLS
nr:MAG TPA: hypothetical protein [Caudoviricetes sp.]